MQSIDCTVSSSDFRFDSNVFPDLSLQYGGMVASAHVADGINQLTRGQGTPSLLVSATDDNSVRADLSEGSRAFAALSYAFVVVGPNAGPVPIVFFGNTEVFSRGSNAVASADVEIFNEVGIEIAHTEAPCGPTNVSGCGFTPYLLIADFQSYRADGDGFSGSVFLDARANAGAQLGGSESSAFIDPYISIDPTFLANNPGYELRVSAGIGNEPPTTNVDAPSGLAFALMITGGLLGSLRKRRDMPREFRTSD